MSDTATTCEWGCCLSDPEHRYDRFDAANARVRYADTFADEASIIATYIYAVARRPARMTLRARYRITTEFYDYTLRRQLRALLVAVVVGW